MFDYVDECMTVPHTIENQKDELWLSFVPLQPRWINIPM